MRLLTALLAPFLVGSVMCGPHADIAASNLVAKWFDNKMGQWPDAGWWNSANAVEALVNHMIYTNSTAYLPVIRDVYGKQADAELLLSGSYDDIQWWALAWVRAYQLTGEGAFLARARLVFDHLVATVWDDKTCGGGLWWSSHRSYKNAITNELFLALSMALHLHGNTARNTTYLQWAQREWAWFSASGMINSQGLINDGLTSACKNNGQMTWTYNQGVVLSGLSELWRTTGNDSLVATARLIATAATTLLVYADGILRESCEPSGCDNDAKQFKGIFVRHLNYFNTLSPAVSFTEFIARNAASIWEKDSSDGTFGVVWNGPFGQAGSVQQTAALDAFSAAGV